MRSEAGPGVSGPLWQGPPGRYVDTLPLVPRQREGSGRAADPLDELADRMEELAAAAVHPDEIAAILESDGMTDDHIRLTYGREDSFTLAEELYARIPRSYPEPPGPPVDPWRVGLFGCLLRGLVFALPGLAYVLGAPLLRGAGLAPLLAGALTGWVWNQALSHRAYSWLGLGDREAAARSLLAGAPAGALLGAAAATAAALASPGPGRWPAAGFAAAQALYLSAATVLLVLDRERALLCALLPMTAGAVLGIPYEVGVPVRVGLLVVSLGAAVWLAGGVLGAGGFPRTGRKSAPPAIEARGFGGGATARGLGRSPSSGMGVPPRRSSGGGRGGGKTRPPVRASIPHGLFGLGTGLLVLHTALGDVLAGGPGAVVSAPSAVALTLSMGPAEWLLHRCRGESLTGLRASTTSRAFRRGAAAVLAECLAGYLAILFVLAVGGTLLWPDAPALGGVRLATLLLIGTALWTGLLLQSFGAVTAAAAVCCTAALAQTVALFTGAGSTRLLGLGVAAGAAGLLAGLVCVLLGRATAHRI
ncbi:hypothetical protein OG905_29710 [Streptomyces sp. NBC_00322]|uniref:hypothetical protein n=1 Tax=Streptomyces sp. NBC_00322 TaxID=2975712 RepID=UPI002E2D6CA3|nr:hypothetical protein [Streptomyces sp. NBC_00322]